MEREFGAQAEAQRANNHTCRDMTQLKPCGAGSRIPHYPNHSLLAEPIFLSAPCLLYQRCKHSSQSPTLSLTAAEEGNSEFICSSLWRAAFLLFSFALTTCGFQNH